MAHFKCEKCQGVLCSCGLHLGPDRTAPDGYCWGCFATDENDAGRMPKEMCSAICEIMNEVETHDNSCPECEGGRGCHPMCEDCKQLEYWDRLDHERAHGVGRE